MKRIISFILVIVIAVSLAPAGFAASAEAVAAADRLYELGLFKGTGSNADGTPNYALDRAPTRFEAVTMLVRLLGKEAEAKSKTWETPFTDLVPWAEPYVGYAYNHGLTDGTGKTTFSGNRTVTATQYLTFVLRALGYDSSTDFKWNAAWELTDRLGLTNGEYSENNNASFLRADAVIVSNDALEIKLKGTNTKLYDGILTKAASPSFESVLADINAEKKALIENKGAFTGFSNWLKSDRSLLTQAEVDSLKANSSSTTVSYAQAVSDIELYFRTLKYAYGAYYYFGGDAAFNAAKAEALAAISGKTNITPAAIAQAIFKSVDFVMDGHFSIGGSSIVEYEEYKKVYFYSDLEFCKEGDRFYTYIDGEKWYFTGFSNPNASIEYTLKKDGQLAYSPALICPVTEAGSDTVTLTNGAMTKTLAVKWTQSSSMLGSYSPAFDFKTLEEKGVGYISIRSFDGNAVSTLNDFAATGADFKDAEVIIFDIRGNGGGSDIYGDMWVKNFTGQNIALPTAHSNRVTALSHGTLGNERIEEIYIDGKVIPNDIPILVLVDNYCASAGESMLLFLKTLENAVIIGSSSAGYQLAGNRVDLTLPNSGVPFSFGTSFSFKFDTTNVDGVGYAPDVYCDPINALDAALRLVGSNMKIEHDLESGSGFTSFDPGSSRINIEFFDSTIFAGQTFGTNAGTHTIPVFLDGNETANFTFTNTKDSVVAFTKVDGKLRMKITGNGYSVLSVTAGGVTTSFGVFVDNFVDVPDGISVYFQGRFIKPGEGFGYHTGMDTIRVNIDGVPTTDYTYKLSDPSVVDIFEMDGETFVYFKKNGSTKFTVTAGGKTAEFRIGVVGHEDAGSPRITIDYCGVPVYAGQGFGWNTGVYDLGIYLDGKQISDYTFDYEDNGVISAEREGDKTIVTVTGKGDCFITVTAGGVSTIFRWAAY